MASVVITSHHDELGLYLTYHSLSAVAGPEVEEVIMVADGGTETKYEKAGVRVIRGTFGSPQASRDAGIMATRSNRVVVMESHVVLSSLKVLLQAHEQCGGTLVFPYRRHEGPEFYDVYAAETDWDGTLWYKRLIYEQQVGTYPTSQFGNSCFVVDRDWYAGNRGGFRFLTGWGGEEPLLCLRAWLTGQGCYVTTRAWHAHYLTAGAHQGRTGEKEYRQNVEIVKFLLGAAPPVYSFLGLTEERRLIEEQTLQRHGPRFGLGELRSRLEEIGVR